MKIVQTLAEFQRFRESAPESSAAARDPVARGDTQHLTETIYIGFICLFIRSNVWTIVPTDGLRALKSLSRPLRCMFFSTPHKHHS